LDPKQLDNCITRKFGHSWTIARGENLDLRAGREIVHVRQCDYCKREKVHLKELGDCSTREFVLFF